MKRLPTLRHLFSFLPSLHLSGMPYGFYNFFFFSQNPRMKAVMSTSINEMTGLKLVTKRLADKIDAKVMK